MGIFDKLKGKKENKEAEVAGKKTREVYSMPSLDGKDEITVFRPGKVNNIRHRNNEITQLIMARIIKQREGDTIYFDYTDYVAFELSKEQEISDEIMSAVMRQYERESRGKMQGGQQQYYLGRLIDDRTGWYTFDSKSEAVQNIVNKIVEEQITARNAELDAKMQRRQEEITKQQEFMASIDAKGYLENAQREKNERKQYPTIREVYYPNARSDSRYANYDGVNINTGDILRMRQVNKVGKDGSGTYLYSAYIKNAEHESDVEFLGGQNPDGYAVCFELQKRLEDIVRTGNLQEITKVLTLLSDARNFQDMRQLTYIGEVDKNGQVNRKEKSSSSAIQSRIELMKQEFARAIQQRDQGQQK